MASSKWYCKQNGQKMGPLSSSQLKQLAAGGKLRPDDMILPEGAGKWIPASSIKGLFQPPAAPSPNAPRRGRTGLLVGACAAAALLGGIGTWAVVNATKKEDEPDRRIAVKPEDPSDKPADDSKKPDDSTKKTPPEDGTKKPPTGGGKTEEPLPPTDKKPPDKQPVDPPKPDEAEKKRLEEFQRYLKAGQVLQEAKQYDAAVKALTKAIELMPDSKEALAALKTADEARKEIVVADLDKRKGEDQQRQYRLLMDAGQGNMKRKEYDLAVAAFKDALTARAGDEAAFAALQAAEKARDAVAADAAARAERKKRLDEYRQFMAQGRTALFTNREYDAAIRAFDEAQKVFPGDQTSLGFIREAERARKADATAQALQQQQVQEQLWLLAGLRNVLAEGRLALAAGNLDLAARAFTVAGRIAPNDPAVIQAQLELQQALTLVRAQANYLNLIRAGREALQNKRFDDAVQAFTDAVFLAPGDSTTQDLLRDARRLRDEARAGAVTGQQMQAERVRQLVADARAAIARNDLAAATRSLADARQLAPTDSDVLKALAELDHASKTAVVADRQKRLDAYQQAMKTGQDARNAKRFADAVRSFTEAARLVRDDRQAGKLLQDADRARIEAERAQTSTKQDDDKRATRVRDLLRNGRTALASYQYDNADRAFADASRLAPNDATVQQAIAELDQARKQALHFDLKVEPVSLKLILGGKARLRVAVDRRGRGGYHGPIEVELHRLPAGVSAAQVTVPAGQNSVHIDLSVAGNTTLGPRNDITVVGKVRGIIGHVTSPAFTVNVQKK